MSLMQAKDAGVHRIRKSVSSQMGEIGERMEIDFVVSTGDNFYDDGLSSINDPAFEESFARVYTARSLQKQWYSGKSIFESRLR